MIIRFLVDKKFIWKEERRVLGELQRNRQFPSQVVEMETPKRAENNKREHPRSCEIIANGLTYVQSEFQK